MSTAIERLPSTARDHKHKRDARLSTETAIERLPSTVRVVNRKIAARLIGVCDRTFDTMCAKREAPPSIKISAGRTGWRVSDIEAWLDARPKTAA